MNFDVLFSPEALVAILTLTFLEIVLGIDNIVFISIVTNKLAPKDRPKARRIGLILAMVFRIIMLFSLSFILKLTKPIFEFQSETLSFAMSWQSIIIILGGFFLIYKSVNEIHHKLEGDDEVNPKSKANNVLAAIVQISLLDLVFSFDSILTAIGLVSLEEPPRGFGYVGGMEIIIISIIISIAIMMLFAGPVSDFVGKHPTIQILGLSFLILIGVMLLAEGSHLAHLKLAGQVEVSSIPKSYLYFTIAFSLFIEFLNQKMKKTPKKAVDLYGDEIMDEELK